MNKALVRFFSFYRIIKYIKNFPRRKSTRRIIGLIGYLFVTNVFADCLPDDFVYLSNIDPSIQQDIRYARSHNFIGRPIKGYETSECILTRPAALALKNIQTQLRKENLSLKVYDCYRPQMAVNDFIAWSKLSSAQQMKAEFYPRVDKKDFFTLGYVAEKSGHSRGSTMDLTIIPLSSHSEAYRPGQKLTACYANYQHRYHDNSIDMGTGFDCMDEMAHPDNLVVGQIAIANRTKLRTLMVKQGFDPYDKEWWHFTLHHEPYPTTYFNCPIVSRHAE